MTTIFDALVSAGQAGRIQPTGYTPTEGSWCMVLGSDAPSTLEYIVPGDTFVVGQDAIDWIGDIVRVRGMIRVPETPATFGWQISLSLDTYVLELDVTDYAERELAVLDLSANIDGLAPTFARIALTFTGPGTDPVLVELPALYIDTITDNTSAAQIGLVATFPAEDQSGVLADIPHGIWLTVASFDGSTVVDSTIDVDVDGVPAVVGGVVQVPFSGSLSVAEGPSSLDVVVHIADGWGTYDSEAVVEISVAAETTLGATLTTTYTFTIEDYAPPQVVSARALSATQVELVYSEPVRMESPSQVGDALAPGAYSISATSTPAAELEVVGVTVVSSTVVLLELSDYQSISAAYVVTVLGVLDLVGNEIIPPDNTATWVGFQPDWPTCRNFSLWEMLAGIHRNGDASGDLAKFLAVFQDGVDLLLALIDSWSDIIDPDTAPEQAIDAMLFGLGNPFDFELELPDKRLLLSVLIKIYQSKGTKPGIEDAVFLFLGFEIVVVPLNDPDDAWVLDVSELGEDTILFTNNSYTLFSFDVYTDIDLSPDQLAAMIKIIDYMKVAHEHIANIHQPSDPPPSEPWVLGVGELGEDTELG